MAETKPNEGAKGETPKPTSSPAAASTEGPVDSKGNPAADPDTSTPGTARTVNSEVTNTDGETIEVVTTVNSRPQSSNLGAAQGTQNASEQDPEMFESTGEPIPSIVVKRFYDDRGALVREEANYTYIPKKGLPYPWPLMRPRDEGQAASLKKQYDDFMEKKNEELRTRRDDRRALDRLLRR